MNILMVEPDHKSKFPPLGLLKYSAYHKQYGDTVKYHKGLLRTTEKFDVIYITTLFSWDAPEAIETINFYKNTHPESQIKVGGILATLMPDYIKEHTGITPDTGYTRELDQILPDYDLMSKGSKFDDYSYVFTSRSCRNGCKFCAVKTLDGEFWVNPLWKNQVDLRRPKINIFDNNIVLTPMEHFIDVIQYTIDNKLPIRFEGGIDFRFVNEEHAKWLAKAPIEYEMMRLAFDDIKYANNFQKKARMLLNNGVSNTDISVYVLCNFTDSVEESHYRCREVVKLGIRPIPLFFMPLDHTDKRGDVRMNKNWTPELIENFKHFYTRGGLWRKKDFFQWIKDPNRNTYVDKEIPLCDFTPDRTTPYWQEPENEIYMGKDSINNYTYDKLPNM